MFVHQSIIKRQAFKFQDKIVWPAQDTLPLNGYGNAVNSFKTIANAEAHTRWRISSGLLELSSGAAPTAVFPFAVDVSEVTVGWGAKRGDGAVRLQFNRVPLGGISDKPESNNQPARLYDVKTPGTWVGASDGPRVTADGSELGYLYLHHSDDNLKIDSTAGKVRLLVYLLLVLFFFFPSPLPKHTIHSHCYLLTARQCVAFHFKLT